MTRRARCASLALLTILALATQAAAARRAADARIAAGDLLEPVRPVRVIANIAFTPSAAAGPAHAPFFGTLHMSECEMATRPSVLTPRQVLGRDTKLLPGAALAFFTHEGDLVPFTQDVIRIASAGTGHSYWDIIVQPGQVWSEPGDGEWSRAAFPFALVNSIEGETHNGLALFLYKKGQVSHVRFQIVQQTAPFYVKDHFTAAGVASATWTTASTERLEDMTRVYEAALSHPLRMAKWGELADKVGRSPAGPLPWCDRARFGVWSATKALVNETALLRLAQKFGPGVFELKIADYVPQAAAHSGWRDVSFEDAIDMATGVGNGSAKREPKDIGDGYLDPSYSSW